jgi:hypothetical protein
MNIKILIILALLKINYLHATSRSFSLFKKAIPSIASIEKDFPKKAFLTDKKKAVSPKASKFLQEALRNNTFAKKDLTSFRGEYKEIVPVKANMIAYLEKMVLDLDGRVSLRDGTPENGFNLTSTVIGDQLIIDSGSTKVKNDKLIIRFRKYGIIEDGLLSNQEETTELSWMELKVKLGPESNHHRDITLKFRMLVPDTLIFQYLSAIHNSGSCVITSIHSLCEWAKADARNLLSDIHTIEESLRIIYYDSIDFNVYALMCVTRSAKEYRIPDSDDDEKKDFLVQTTEDRNLSVFSGNIMDFWGSGALNPALFFLFKPKFSLIDTRFIEVKMRDFDPDTNTKQVEDFVKTVEQMFPKKIGKKRLLQELLELDTIE